jgi:signal transduction histidine kinase
METGLFRTVQEAVNNIARHAQASQAWVRITWEPELLTIEVEDDGRGFDVQEAMSDTKSDRGLGLLGMEERVTLIGGTLTINSAPQAGTRIVIQVPLPEVGTHVEDQCVVSG